MNDIADKYKTVWTARFKKEYKLSAAGFYEKCGYKTASDTFIEADVAHVKMRKVL